MEWSDDNRSKPHNGCTTPVLSPQSNATSLKTPNLKQGNYSLQNNYQSLLMPSHQAYTEAQNNQQRKHFSSSPLSPSLLSPFSPPPFSSELQHGEQSYPSTPPVYQSAEKRNLATNGIMLHKRTSNGTQEETKIKPNGEVEILPVTSSAISTTATMSSSSSSSSSSTTTSAKTASNNVEVKMCAACNRSISDRYLLFTADRYWHLDCLRCSSCNVALAEVGSTCFSRSGMTLCRSDYIRMFGSTGICTSCRQTIPANDYVMKTSQGSVYHVTCFCCVRCHRTLVPGDKYGLLHGNLLCENDYWVAMTTGPQPSYNDMQGQPPATTQQQQQQQQQQHHHQQFRGCSQAMVNGKDLPDDHHHHHQHPHRHHHPFSSPQPPQQNQHLNQMKFSHKVG